MDAAFQYGTFFKAIEDYDPDIKRILHQLKTLYHDDPVLNPLSPWDRPPLKNIFCIYGTDLKTEVGYYFAPSGKPYPDNWIITDVIYEIEGQEILLKEIQELQVGMRLYRTILFLGARTGLDQKST
ncbi:hypothetical protein L3X38_022158 [Prunus dulcis]|uniref:Uncharacterized protein n=1 Tax=Prunus dulcis TaxID=3755 RepID=A0AAD4Z444_PRUDU|nr:hypothetical protein L3X38_022158 [Prunus dulcis]